MLRLFLVSSFVVGAAAVAGSMVGAAAGKRGLFIAAILGGLAGSVASAAAARRWQWIRPEAARSTAAGTAIGFLVAAAVATQTLSSPVGPVLSTGLIGIGAILGAAIGRR
jgi:hypothetical protein